MPDIPPPQPPRRALVVSALGTAQIAAWGSSYYLLAVLARPIADDTGWPLPWVVGGFSLALLVSGLLSSRVGDAIERHGGRPVLAGSAVLLALGLIAVALAPSLPFYLAAWVLLGAGMSAGLYDATFGALGRIYGTGARSAISAVTLWGGFASTVSWPVTAVLALQLGWRHACLVYAAFQLLVSLPLYLLALRGTGDLHLAPGDNGAAAAPAPALPLDPRMVAMLVALSLTLAAAISSILSVHLLTMLQQRDVALGAAVALGALVGPSQVGARIVEMTIGRRLHPIWVLITATVLVAVGIALLLAGGTVLPVAMLCYGAGLGITSIARGSLPLALFGKHGFAARMGRIATPVLLVQSVAPLAAAAILQRYGTLPLLVALLVLAVGNAVLAVALRQRLRLG